MKSSNICKQNCNTVPIKRTVLLFKSIHPVLKNCGEMAHKVQRFNRHQFRVLTGQFSLIYILASIPRHLDID